jgi:hypothetical protein
MFGRMKIYTVHIKPGTNDALEKPVFVREGFNVWAFLFTFVHALYHRLWLHALAIMTLTVLIAESHMLSHSSIMVLQLALQLIVGFSANDWKRAALSRRGYIMTDIAASDNLLRAEQRYFERMLKPAS